MYFYLKENVLLHYHNKWALSFKRKTFGYSMKLDLSKTGVKRILRFQL